jgi:hypothetical protein
MHIFPSTFLFRFFYKKNMKKNIPQLLLSVAVFFFLTSCKTGGNAGMSDRFQKGITINNSDTLDAILNRYVNDGLYPCLYARIENFDGKVFTNTALSIRD